MDVGHLQCGSHSRPLTGRLQQVSVNHLPLPAPLYAVYPWDNHFLQSMAQSTNLVIWGTFPPFPGAEHPHLLVNLPIIIPLLPVCCSVQLDERSLESPLQPSPDVQDICSNCSYLLPGQGPYLTSTDRVTSLPYMRKVGLNPVAGCLVAR